MNILFLLRVTVLLGAAQAVLAVKEKPKDEKLAAEQYDNGKVHERLMAHKENLWTSRKEAKASGEWPIYPAIDHFVPCVNGTAIAVEGDPMQTFRCKNIDLYNYRSHVDLGTISTYDGLGSSSWGWTSPEGREFVIFGQEDASVFIEISSEGKILYLGRLPKTDAAAFSMWREIRVYKHYAVIGSEAENHGIQIFDLTKLLDIDPGSPVMFNPNTDLTGLYTGLPIGRTHNVIVNEAMGYIASVGSKPREAPEGGGLIFIEMEDPSNPVSSGYNAEDGYVHDAQCLPYKGPDANYHGRDICYGYNEDTLTIYDVTNRANSSIISITSYEGAAYTHQGWVLDKEWQTYLLLDDELDEYDKTGVAADGYAVTYIWNITSLQAPQLTGYYKTSVPSIDHNQYIWNGFSVQSNYGAGLRILDIRSIPHDPTGKGVHEVGFFDVYPEDDAEEGGGIAEFWGSWSSYAGFKSGFIFINTIERGAWVVKRSHV
ncbi:hypothetical protein DL96DRAFT_1786768 [Flagelloscypha sp. PMI_526]|nr:hypothetical protein DL96DRAFT_1786768 [Flagelloscypha sp. PMI_526]